MSKVTLCSSDGEEFVVERAVADMSATVKTLLADVGDAEAPIPLPNVSTRILSKVIEYCKHHHEAGPAASASGASATAAGAATGADDKKDEKRTDDIMPWDAEFAKVDQATLFDLILAANYLDIKPLLDLTCKTVANMIKGKSPEEIRKTFNIKNVCVSM